MNLRFPFMFQPNGWFMMIHEFLIVIDASVFVLTLGVVEINLSVAWYNFHEESDNES